MLEVSSNGPYSACVTLQPIKLAFPSAATLPTVTTVGAAPLAGLPIFDSWAWRNRKWIIGGAAVGVGLLGLSVVASILR